MVADLFGVGGAAVDPALEGLAEDGVEGLLHAEVEEGVGDPEGDGPGQSEEEVLVVQLLEEEGGVEHAVEEALDVAFGGEDVDGETDAEDGLAGEDVLGDLGEHELQHALLVLDLLLVDEDHPALLVVVDPLASPDRVPSDRLHPEVRGLLQGVEQVPAFPVGFVDYYAALVVQLPHDVEGGLQFGLLLLFGSDLAHFLHGALVEAADLYLLAGLRGAVGRGGLGAGRGGE